ncbi:hypothetical protein AAFF_G00394320 [Aldrovandia affinis]|uniref:Uncharacterized protein n=1 Tax=Aldrovandia affinis TaxID=143900 RepID=A0AAD7WKZ3_9TELE|nr:hypothetical protein AAFF_G00394320 [Aldrovandia affinis]
MDHAAGPPGPIPATRSARSQRGERKAIKFHEQGWEVPRGAERGLHVYADICFASGEQLGRTLHPRLWKELSARVQRGAVTLAFRQDADRIGPGADSGGPGQESCQIQRHDRRCPAL